MATGTTEEVGDQFNSDIRSSSQMAESDSTTSTITVPTSQYVESKDKALLNVTKGTERFSDEVGKPEGLNHIKEYEEDNEINEIESETETEVETEDVGECQDAEYLEEEEHAAETSREFERINREASILWNTDDFDMLDQILIQAEQSETNKSNLQQNDTTPGTWEPEKSVHVYKRHNFSIKTNNYNATLPAEYIRPPPNTTEFQIISKRKSVVAHFTHEEMMRHAYIKRLKEKDDIERLQMEEEKQKKHKRQIEKMQKNYTPALESATSFLDRECPHFKEVKKMFGPSKRVEAACLEDTVYDGKAKLENYRQQMIKEMALRGIRTIKKYIANLNHFLKYIEEYREEKYDPEKHNSVHYMRLFLEDTNKKGMPYGGKESNYSYFSTSSLGTYLSSFGMLYWTFNSRKLSTDLDFTHFNTVKKSILTTIINKFKAETLTQRRVKSTITYEEYRILCYDIHDSMSYAGEPKERDYLSTMSSLTAKVSNPFNVLVLLTSSFAGFHRSITSLNMAVAHFHLVRKQLPKEKQQYTFLCVDRSEQKIKTQTKELSKSMFYRHKDVFLCPVLAIAMKMFIKLENDEKVTKVVQRVVKKAGATVSEFGLIVPMGGNECSTENVHIKDSGQWIADSLLNMSYQSCNNSLKKIYVKNQFETSAITHAPRRLAAVHTQDKGCLKSEIADAAYWSLGSEINGVNKYVRATSHDVAKVLAGFELSEQYHIYRSQIKIPEQFKSMIFSWNRIRPKPPNIDAFQEVLSFLADVLIQDLPFIFHKYPNHVLKQFIPFNTDAFEEFAKKTVDEFEKWRKKPQVIDGLSHIPVLNEINDNFKRLTKDISLIKDHIFKSRESEREDDFFERASNYHDLTLTFMRREQIRLQQSCTEHARLSAARGAVGVDRLLNLSNSLFSHTEKFHQEFYDFRATFYEKMATGGNQKEGGKLGDKRKTECHLNEEDGAVIKRIKKPESRTEYIDPTFDIDIQEFLYQWLIGYLPCKNWPLVKLKSKEFKAMYPHIKLAESLTSSFKSYIRVARVFMEVFERKIHFQQACCIQEMVSTFEGCLLEHCSNKWNEKAFKSPRALAGFLKGGKEFKSVKEREEAVIALLKESNEKNWSNEMIG